VSQQPPLITISADDSLSADDVSRKTFPTVRRGFDPAEVRNFLHYVADGLRVASEREHDLASQVTEANARAESPEITDSMLARALGSETARVLQTAHEAAHEIVARAEARSAELLEEASTVHERSQRDADAEATRILAAATAEIETARESLRAEAARLMETTKSDCREMVAEAREVRSRILQDLSTRRKTIRAQIDQLLAGRVTVLSALGGARDSIDDITERLARGVHEESIPADESGARESTDEDIEADLSRRDASVDVRLAQPAPVLEEEPPPAPDTAPEAGVEPDAEPPLQAQAPVVDELFAKIRASSSEDAHADAGGDAVVAPVQKEGEAPAPVEPEAEAEAEVEVEVEVAKPTPSPAQSDSEVALSRRDELLEPAFVQLARSLKRALQDDQNELQDRLRQAPVGAGLDDVFALEEQRERLSQAALAGMEAAWVAGSEFAGASGSAASGGAALHSATSLAAEVCGSLRPRIENGLGELGGGDKTLNDVIGAAYRDLKGGRLEVMAGDHATSAFAAGEVAALHRKRGPQLEVTWLVDDGGTPCPDCADNALAGQQELGREFPTGQTHPPAHPGCRCVLVPAG
jgi:DivIVA domain-containing protein